VRRHVSYANVMSTLAVFLAIAGGSTAIAISVSASKKSDVNKKGNIRAGRVTTAKLANGAVTAAKLAGADLIQATALNSSTATCPPGEQLLGGGGDVPSGAGAALQTSRPTGNGWQAVVSAGVGNRDVVAYAVCARN
jgi:hypothetical protein